MPKPEPSSRDRAAARPVTRPEYDADRLTALVAATLPHFGTVQEGVIEALRQAILTDVLPVGARLRQEDLAGVFRTSRIPIREALRVLEYEGLVRSEAYRGFSVAGLDAEQIDEMYELRTVLEEHAVRVAIPLLTERDIAELDVRFHDLDESHDFEQSLARLEEFYLRLYAVTARPRLVGLIARLRQESVRSFRWWQIRPSRAHHAAFYEAIRAGDADRAVDELSGHYRRVAALVRRFLRESELAGSAAPDPIAGEPRPGILAR
jgi:DNA-binding GntR family transcriptional regulator